MHDRLPSLPQRRSVRSAAPTSLLLLGLLLGSASLAAQPVRQLADLYTGGRTNSSSRPEQFVALGAETVFVASDFEHGRELWITDGTSAGTRLLADLRPGRFAGNPRELVLFDGQVYFAASDESLGEELFRTDGTAEGTVRVGDLQPGHYSSGPRNLTVAGSRLFFTASTIQHGNELWVLPAGGSPQLVDDLRPGPGSSSPRYLAAVGDRIGFSAYTEELDRELYVSDGTAEGTDLYELFLAGTVDPRPMAAIGDLLFYSAAPPDFGRELYRVDVGTGLKRRLTYLPSADGNEQIGNPSLLAGELLFTVRVGGVTTLWRSDGESTGTEELATVDARGLVTLESAVFFVADGDLWTSDGTGPGTVLIADLAEDIREIGFGDDFLVVHEGELFFHTASDVWSSDGTDPGTEVYDDCGIADCFEIDVMDPGADGVYMAIRDSFAGEEPWRAAGGIVDRLADLHQDVGNAEPFPFTAFDGRVLFPAWVDGAGRELASWDGTIADAQLFEDLLPGTGSSAPSQLTPGAAGLFYRGQTPTAGQELLLLPDTASPTEVVADLEPGTAGSYPSILGAVAEGLFFSVEDEDDVDQLWYTSGSGATQVTAFPSDAFGVDHSGSSGLPPSGALGGELYFNADDGNVGYEPWTSDGASAALLRDLNLGPAHSYPDSFVALDGWMYFEAGTGSGRGLWRTDGTFQNTELLREFDGGGLGYLHAVGDRIVFLGVEEATGSEMWASDGTPGGTVILEDVDPGPEHGVHLFGGGLSFAVAGDLLYFAAGGAATGAELWLTDGTPAGTRPVADLRPGPESSAPWFLTPLSDGGIVFVATGDGFGEELWRSDGTAVGTRRVSDVAPGGESASILYPTVFGDWVVFHANDGSTGTEAWAYDWSSDSALFVDGFESGDASGW